MSDLVSFIISNTAENEFSGIWKWISCCNDVMNHVECVIKLDVYPQKMHSCSKNIRGISVFVLKYPRYIKKIYITSNNVWIFAWLTDKYGLCSKSENCTYMLSLI